ncbi:MAG: MFS transporter [Verrucomicrobia bacterium]|nr:MFS transporter [Verrucomicrobiota bacterium]
MRQVHFRHRLTGMVGNILEHYDNALFGLLAPFIAPLFFENKDPLTALILTYGMLPLGILMRPLGSLFFGWIGDQFGRTRALFCSMFGMSIATIAMGCLPTYAQVGFYAPFFLAFGRIMQNFCAAGESVGGAIFVLEHTDSSRKNLMSGIYDASSIGGILLASGLITLFSFCGTIGESWRYLFWFGAFSALIGIFLRMRAQEGMEYRQAVKSEKVPLFALIGKHREALLAITCVSGFSYTTYSLAFTLMNGYVPLVTSLSKTEVMGANTLLLVLDMFMLPLFGYLAGKSGREKVMSTAALAALFCALPLFYMLQEASLGLVVAARLMIVTLGVAFSASYHAWSQEMVPAHARYTILSLGYALGSQLIGAPSVAVSLWLYKKMGWFGAPALYIMGTAALAAFFIRKYSYVYSDNNAKARFKTN